MGAEETSPGLKLKSSITDASKKIEGIIDDAERAAAEIRADARAEAEREAQRILRESTSGLTEVMHPLIERIENLRVEAAALMHEIETASLQLTKLSGTEATTATSAPAASAMPKTQSDVPDSVIAEPPPSKPLERPEAVVATSAPGPAPVAYPGKNEPAPQGGVPEEAVLRATQMAVAGSSRAEIEATLQSEFGLEDAAPVVNDILGE